MEIKSIFDFFKVNRITLFVFIMYFLIAIYATREILFKPGMFVNVSEWNISPFSEQIKNLFTLDFFPWKNYDYGAYSDSPKGIFYNAYLYILATLGFNGDVITKIVVLVPIFSSGFLTYLLCRYIKLPHIASFMGGLFYMMAPPLVDRILIGHTYISSDIALMPLTIITFLTFLNHKSAKNFAIASFVLVFATSHLSTFGLLVILFGILTLFYNTYNRSDIFSNLLVFFSVIITSIIIHGYWMDILNQVMFDTIGFRFSGIPLYSMASRLEMDWFQALTVYSNQVWPNMYVSFFDNPQYQWLSQSLTILFIRAPLFLIFSFIPVFIIFIGIFANFKNRIVIAFSVISIIAYLLYLGNTIPFYQWALEKIPLFLLYRDPHKWAPLLNISLTILFAFTFKTLEDNSVELSPYRIVIFAKNRKSTLKQIASLIIAILLSTSLFLGHFTFFDGNFGGYLEPFEFSNQYREAYYFLNSDNEQSRAIILPAPYPTSYNGMTPSAVGIDTYALFPGKDPIYTGKYGVNPQIEPFLFKTLIEGRTKYIGNLAGTSNVKYFTFDNNKSTFANSNYFTKTFFPLETYTNEKIIDSLNNQEDIEKIEQFSTIEIFRNNDYQPRIRAYNNVFLSTGELDQLTYLSYLPSELQNYGVIFVNQLLPNEIQQLLQLPNVIILGNGDTKAELIANSFSKDNNINILEYANPSQPENQWAIMNLNWHNWYYQAALEKMIYTFGQNAKINFPLVMEKQSDYIFMMKTSMNSPGSVLDINLDGKYIDSITTNGVASPGFKWYQVSLKNVTSGDHELTITNKAGENGIAKAIIIPESIFVQQSNEINHYLETKSILELIKPDLSNIPLNEIVGERMNIDTSSPLVQNYGEFKNNVTTTSNSIKMEVDNNATIGTGIGMNIKIKVDIASLPKFQMKILENISKNMYWRVLLIGKDIDDRNIWFRLTNEPVKGDFKVVQNNSKLIDILVQAEIWTSTKNETVYEKQFNGIIKELKLNNVVLTDINIAFETIISEDKSNKSNSLTIKDLMFIRPSYWEIKDMKFSSSGGFIMQSPSDTTNNIKFKITRAGNYSISLNANSNDPFIVSIANESILFSPKKNGEIYQTKLMSFPSDEIIIGIRSLSGQNDSVFQLDSLLVSTDFVVDTNILESVNFDRISPVEYSVNIEKNQSLFLFFSEKYSPNWIMKYNNERIQGIPGFSFGNMYFVNGEGDNKLTLYYDLEDAFLVFQITSIVLICTLLFMITPWFNKTKKIIYQRKILFNT